MFKKENIDSIWIWNEEFKGIGYQGLLTTNTKNYVDSPTRMNDGSMPNLPDHDSFIVPRAKVNFKKFSIEDYQRLCRVINQANEFPVTYFDKQVGDFVTHNMYCEPEQMTRLFNVGTKIIGVLNYEISFIGTLNNLKSYTIAFCSNIDDSDNTILSSASLVWSDSFTIMGAVELTEKAIEKGIALPTGKTFKGWNTRRDGLGITYFPNSSVAVFENMTLYAQWVAEV